MLQFYNTCQLIYVHHHLNSYFKYYYFKFVEINIISQQTYKDNTY